MTERRSAAVSIATCLGVGYLPLAPGTFGSAVGLGLVAAIGHLPLGRACLVATVGALALGLGAVGVWAAGHAEKFFERTDPGQVVIDEVVGQMVTLVLSPDPSWKCLLSGFLIFRALDVMKPFPLRRLERAPRGWGIMLDDLGAGIYGLGVLALLGWVLKVK